MGSALSAKNYESPVDRRLAGGFLAGTSYQAPSSALIGFPCLAALFEPLRLEDGSVRDIQMVQHNNCQKMI